MTASAPCYIAESHRSTAAVQMPAPWPTRVLPSQPRKEPNKTNEERHNPTGVRKERQLQAQPSLAGLRGPLGGEHWLQEASDDAQWRNAYNCPIGLSAVQEDNFAGCVRVPPAGFEPALTAPEAVALSPELRGLRTPQDYQSGCTRCAASRRHGSA